MARYRFIRKLDTERVELRLTLIVKEYNFISPKLNKEEER